MLPANLSGVGGVGPRCVAAGGAAFSKAVEPEGYVPARLSTRLGTTTGTAATSERLAPMSIGEFLREVRTRADVLQHDVAVGAGISQAALSLYESGKRIPRIETVEKILAAMGMQLRWAAEPMWADVDREIDAMRALSIDERVANLRVLLPQLLDDLGGYDPLLDGACAAMLQGAPVPAKGLEIAVPKDDFESFAESIAGARSLQRWSDRWKQFGYVDRDPRVEGGPLHWDGVFGQVKARVISSGPAYVTIVAEGRPCRVRPLTDIESDDPWVARVLARMRDRLASAA